MVGSNFGPEYRGLRYMDSNINKTKTVLLMTRVSVLVNKGVDIDIIWNERIHTLSMTFLDHFSRPHSEKCRYTDFCKIIKSHNTNLTSWVYGIQYY